MSATPSESPALLIHRRKAARAFAMLAEAVRAEPGDSALLLAYGVLARDLGRHREAVRVLARAVRREPQPDEVLLALLDTLQAAGRRRFVHRAWGALLARQPAEAGFRAELLLRLGRCGEAEREARKALGAGRRGFEVLAAALVRQRRFIEARQVLADLAAREAAQAVEPSQDGGAAALRGRVELLLGERAAAAAHFEEAVRLRPTDWRTWLRLIRLVADGGEKRQLRKLLLRARNALWWQPPALLALARLLVARDDRAVALETCARIMELAPAATEAALLRAHCLLRLGRGGEATALLETLEASGAKVPAERLRRLWTEIDLDAAIAAGAAADIAALFERLCAEGPDAQTLAWVAERLAKEELHAELVALFEPLDAARSSADCQYLLGVAQFKLQRPAQAVAVLQQAVQLAPGDRRPRQWLEIVERAQGTAPADDPFQHDPLAARPRTSLLDSIVEHGIVVKALILRETRTRFGRQRLGYLMAVVEPLIMLVAMLIIVRYIRDRQPAGMSLELFVLTGVMTLRFFTRTMSQVSQAVRSNRPLLAFPRVTPFDARIARALLEVLTLTIVTLIFAAGLHIAGGQLSLDQPLYVIGCVLVACLLGFAAGMVIDSLRGVWQSVDMVTGVINRFLFVTSGVFFSVHDLPKPILQWALLNPMLHVIENVRHGAQESFPLHNTSMVYPVACAFGLLLVAFILDSRLRRRRLEA